MGRSTTRQPVRKSYLACKDCECDISGYGKCQKGYDNFYYRLGKNNGCDKCKDEKQERKYEERFWRSIREKIKS